MPTPDLLFRADDLPFYGLVVIWPAACRTEAIHVILDIVETELADLW
jgi:hypothetical protein